MFLKILLRCCHHKKQRYLLCLLVRSIYSHYLWDIPGDNYLVDCFFYYFLIIWLQLETSFCRTLRLNLVLFHVWLCLWFVASSLSLCVVTQLLTDRNLFLHVPFSIHFPVVNSLCSHSICFDLNSEEIVEKLIGVMTHCPPSYLTILMFGATPCWIVCRDMPLGQSNKFC
jgi:hypothetical protein